MRWKTSWIACCVAVCAIYGYAQEWERLDFLPRSSSFKGVAVTDRYVYAAGALGTLVRTEIGSEMWTALPSENLLWRRVRFVSDSVGWLCSEVGIVARTIDAGETWANSNVGSVQVRDIWSPDGLRAVAVGEYGYVCLTFDGGETWLNHIYSFDQDDDLLAVDFPNDSVGCAVGGYGATRAPRILTTHDGGLSWTLVTNSFHGWLATVKYISDSVVIAAGKYGQILRSTDQGATWDSVYAIGNGDYAIREIDFANALEGTAVTDHGKILNTLDGGLTWTMRGESFSDLQGIDFNLLGYGVAVGAYGVSYSEDSGLSWSTLRTVPGGDVYDIDFLNDENGWLLTQGNYALRTVDGGESWVVSSVPTSGTPVLISALSENTAVVMSNASELFRTENGGAHWSQVFLDDSYGLTDMSFANADTGFACGQLGRILVTYDGGQSWSLQDSLSRSINAIHAIDGTHVWAVGNAGIVARKCGDEPWGVHSEFPQNQDFVGVYFANAEWGVITGSTGSTVATNDGGATWHHAPSQNAPLTDIHFANQWTGWIAGDGVLARTDDAGWTWSEFDEFLGLHFSALAVTPHFVWVVGDDGSVYRGEYIPNATDPASAPLPGEFSLAVFPNPFNSTATMKFDLPREMRVEIELFDVLGRTALKLSDDVFSAGTHSLAIDAATLASGVYFANLRTVDFSTTQKLLLLR